MTPRDLFYLMDLMEQQRGACSELGGAKKEWFTVGWRAIGAPPELQSWVYVEYKVFT